MSADICVVPGSYDPVTKGHMDIIQAAADIFDHVVVAVLCNTEKKYLFSVSQRIEMLGASCEPVPGSIELRAWDGLLVALLDETGADIVVRGLRDARDFDFERQIAQTNAVLRPRTRTLWMGTEPQHQSISSTIVRELLRFGADVRPFVPHEALPLIQEYSAQTKGLL